MSLGELARSAHGLAPHLPGPSSPPVRGALGGDKGNDAIDDGQRALGGGAWGWGAGGVLGGIVGAAEAGGGAGGLGGEGTVATGPVVSRIA